jgi:hypothetical protein
MTLQTIPHTISVVLNYAAIGIGIYFCVRWKRKRNGQRLTETPSSAPPKKRLASAISKTLVYLVISSAIVGIVFVIPERMGRSDATAVCNAIPAGTMFRFDVASLDTYRRHQKSKYDTLFAATYYPKVQDIQDGNGAVILVFLGGFPFSRAYCVLNLKEGTVESTRLMFNAEDYAYCDGEMHRLWECSNGKQK